MATVTAGNAERWGRPGKHVGLLVRKKEEADGCCFIFIREFEIISLGLSGEQSQRMELEV